MLWCLLFVIMSFCQSVTLYTPSYQYQMFPINTESGTSSPSCSPFRLFIRTFNLFCFNSFSLYDLDNFWECATRKRHHVYVLSIFQSAVYFVHIRFRVVPRDVFFNFFLFLRTLLVYVALTDLRGEIYHILVRNNFSIGTLSYLYGISLSGVLS